ncbi:MAG: type II secretion system F family protein [Planctomycetota bacterium]
MKLAYQALDAQGREVAGLVEARDALAASDQLRRDGLFPSSLTESRDDAATGQASAVSAPAASPRRGGNVGSGSARQTAVFTRQLYVLLSAGTPLDDALAALERQAQDPKWKAVLTDVRGHVQRGGDLSDALARHPKYFDQVLVGLVEAGQASGDLLPLLERIGAMTQKQVQLRHQLRGALVYPALLSTISVGVVLVLLLFVLPQFATMFESLDVELPPTTAALLVLSDLMRGYWWAAVPAAIAAVMGVVWLAVRGTGAQALQKTLLSLPRIGPLLADLATARMARVLGVLLQSHTPVLEALALTRRSVGWSSYAELLRNAETAVTQGQPISSPFVNSPLIRPEVAEVIRTGESNGQIGPLLLHLADYLDEENEVMVKSVTSIIEPLILLALGSVVALVATSMFLPLFDMTAVSSGGMG